MNSLTANHRSFEINSYSLSLEEELFGFDEEFAKRVKQVWSDSSLTKKSFQNDLDDLNKRWDFSLFLDGAQQRSEGLSGTFLNQIAYSALGIGFGSILIRNISNPFCLGCPSISGNILSLFTGIGSVWMGLQAPIKIYANCVSEARKSIFEAIVYKNLGAFLKPADCQRLTKSFVWADKKAISFDLTNENHLRANF